MQTFCITYAANNEHIKYALISIYSLLKNLTLYKDKIFEFYLLSDRFSSSDYLEINKFVNKWGGGGPIKFNLTPIEIDENELNSGLIDTSEKEKLLLSQYFRLLIPKYLPNTINQCLYLDTDTLIRGDITELFNYDLISLNLGCAAVTDLLRYCNDQERMFSIISRKCIDDNKRKILIKLKHEKIYFNSGVLLINLKFWRENNISDKCLDFMRNYPSEGRDQDAINCVLEQNLCILPVKWNFQKDISKARSKIIQGLGQIENVSVEKIKEDVICSNEMNSIIYHFADKPKPWNKEPFLPDDGYLPTPYFYREWLLIANESNVNFDDCAPILDPFQAAIKSLLNHNSRLFYKYKKIKYLNYFELLMISIIIIYLCLNNG